MPGPPPTRMSPYGWLTLAVAFAAAAVVVAAFYGADVWHGGRSRRWPRTEGIVRESDLVYYHGPKSGDTHAPYVGYDYTVGGRAYEAERVGFADVRERGDPAEHLARVRASYPVGSAIDVFYDPDAPARACLVPGIDPALLWSLVGITAVQLGAAAYCAVGFVRRRRDDPTPSALPPAP